MSCKNKCNERGRMNHRVRFMKPSYTNTGGEQSATYSAAGSRPCSARPMTTREVIQSEQVFGELGWIIEVHYDSMTKTVKQDWQLVLTSFDDKTFDLEGPPMPVDGERQILRIRAMEKVTNTSA